MCAASLLLGVAGAAFGCRSTATGEKPVFVDAPRGESPIAAADLHGDIRGRAIVNKTDDAPHFIVEVHGARPGRYAVSLANAVACPWDASGRPRTSGSPGVETGAGTGAGGYTGRDVPLGAARESTAPDLSERGRIDRVQIGEIQVNNDGSGLLDTKVPIVGLDLNDRAVLEANTILVRDAGADNVTSADVTTGLIACGRFVEAEKRLRPPELLHPVQIPMTPGM